jgi:hypothetical protein
VGSIPVLFSHLLCLCYVVCRQNADSQSEKTYTMPITGQVNPTTRAASDEVWMGSLVG